MTANTLMYSSNPQVDQLSMPIPGVGGETNGASDRDNARQLDEGIPNVSDFKTENVDIFKVNVTGTSTGNNNSLIDLSINSSDCFGTATIASISYSIDGKTYINVPSTYIQGNYIVDFPMPQNRHIYFKVTMSCTYNGVTSTKDKVVKVRNTDYDPCAPTTGINFLSNKDEIENYSVSPNPLLSGENIVITFRSNLNQDISISLTSINGIQLHEETNFYKRGEHQISINLENYFSGVLISKIETKNQITSRKIIVYEK